VFVPAPPHSPALSATAPKLGRPPRPARRAPSLPRAPIPEPAATPPLPLCLLRSGTNLTTNGTTGNKVCGFIAAGNFNNGSSTAPVPAPCAVNTAQPVDWTWAAAINGCPNWWVAVHV
jgi:hypothetical protein